MFLIAKNMLKFLSALAVIVIVSVIAISIMVGGNTANALPWVAIFAFALWLPSAAICSLVMAVTSKGTQQTSIVPRKRERLEWAIAAFFLLLSMYLIYSVRWRLGLVGTPIKLVGSTEVLITIVAALLSLASTVAVLSRRAWASSVLLILAPLLFVQGTYKGFPLSDNLSAGQLFVGLFVAIGMNYFPAMVSLASHIYLRKQSGN